MSDTKNPEAEIARDGGFPERAEAKQVRRERAAAGGPAGLVGRVGQFLRDVRAEMKRVSWPSAKDVKNTTIITLVAVVFFSVYLFLVDRLWAFLLVQLNHLLNWITGI
jgi:preprotein translocase subunit SecE